MNFVKSVILSLFCLISTSALSEAVYDASTGIVTIPVVTVGNTYVYEAKLQFAQDGRWDLIGYSLSPPATAVSDTCTSSHITLENYNKLSFGMTYEQVSAILGCAGEIGSQHIVLGVHYVNYVFVTVGSPHRILVAGFGDNKLEGTSKSGL